MPKILVCQHVPHELLGTLNPLLKSSGFRIHYVNFGRHPDLEPALDSYDGLIILGGPMNVDDTQHHPHLTTEIKMIEAALKRDIPVLGICLGAQLIAKTLGASVKKNPIREIGWYDVVVTEGGKTDPLFQHCEPSKKIFQWHQDTFDLPHGAVHLARSDTCDNQAFLYGNKVYGLQFHLEVDEPMIERWLKVPDNRQQLVESRGEFSAELILSETVLHIAPLKQLSKKVFGEFAGLFGFAKKARLLGSR